MLLCYRMFCVKQCGDFTWPLFRYFIWINADVDFSLTEVSWDRLPHLCLTLFSISGVEKGNMSSFQVFGIWTLLSQGQCWMRLSQNVHADNPVSFLRTILSQVHITRRPYVPLLISFSNSSPMTLEESLDECMEALDLFLNNHFNESMERLRSK